MVERRQVVRRALRAARDALRRITRGTADFVLRVYDKAGQDDIFFLAGAIAFNILVAAVPFLLLVVAGLGLVLRTYVEDPQQVVLNYVASILPASRSVTTATYNYVNEVMDGAARFGILGLVLLIWFSTRLIGSLRTALRDIFDLQEDRGIIWGKIFDVQMVIVAGSLFVANTGITAGLEAVQTYGVELSGLRPVEALQALYAQIVAFAFIFVMFVLIYRYLPLRRTPWRVSLVAAIFTSLSWEVLKSLFAWYVAQFADYSTMYGAFATLVLLVFWIYYSSVVFILGGEVGQVYDLQRTRRRQREALD